MKTKRKKNTKTPTSDTVATWADHSIKGTYGTVVPKGHKEVSTCFHYAVLKVFAELRNLGRGASYNLNTIATWAEGIEKECHSYLSKRMDEKLLEGKKN